MQKQLQDLSRLRQVLRRLLAELERTVQVAFGRHPLVKGNVYELVRKCGKPSCACNRGKLHRSMVLSWSEQGKSRLLSIPVHRVAELRQKSEQYLRFRRARAQVSKISRQIVALLDRIEALRQEEP
ncbi:MAG: hypothetical protein HY694_03550 [Deltaproteobacteria bacterium]|nr:hypothetical protein [Deltaproteobacteria bacterium]